MGTCTIVSWSGNSRKFDFPLTHAWLACRRQRRCFREEFVLVIVGLTNLSAICTGRTNKRGGDVTQHHAKKYQRQPYRNECARCQRNAVNRRGNVHECDYRARSVRRMISPYVKTCGRRQFRCLSTSLPGHILLHGFVNKSTSPFKYIKYHPPRNSVDRVGKS